MRDDSSGCCWPPVPANPAAAPPAVVVAPIVVAESLPGAAVPVGVLGMLSLLSLLLPNPAKLALRLDIDGRGGRGPGLVAVGVAGDEGEENCDGDDIVCTKGGRPPWLADDPDGEAGTRSVALVMVVVATEVWEEE